MSGAHYPGLLSMSSFMTIYMNLRAKHILGLGPEMLSSKHLWKFRTSSETLQMSLGLFRSSSKILTQDKNLIPVTQKRLAGITFILNKEREKLRIKSQ